MSEVEAEEEKKHFEWLFQLHKIVAGYASPHDWESLFEFERHITLKFADTAWLTEANAEEIHARYHETEQDRLIAESQ
jgi:hypothetical protein